MQLGEGQRLPIVGYPAFGIKPVRMGRDVAEQIERMGCETRLAMRGFDRPICQAPRLVKLVEQQTSTTYCAVGPAAMADDASRHLMFEELLSFPDPVLRLAPFADLRQGPSGGGDRPRELDRDVASLQHRDPVPDP